MTENQSKINKVGNFVKQNALSLSGASLLIAEALSLLSGTVNLNFERTIGGGSGVVSNGVSTLFGQTPRDNHKTWGEKIGERLYSLRLLKKTPDSFRLDKNPFEISSAIGVATGLSYFVSGLNSASNGEWEMARGLLIAGILTYMVLVPEKDNKKKKQADNKEIISEKKKPVDDDKIASGTFLKVKSSASKIVGAVGDNIRHPDKALEWLKTHPVQIGNAAFGAVSGIALGQGIANNDPYITAAAAAYFLANVLRIAFVRKNAYLGNHASNGR